MRRIERVFLAGPDAFAPDGAAVVAAKRELVEAAGFAPLAAALPDPGVERDEIAARVAYADTLSALREADAAIANLSPWRGPGADASTAFQAGFAAALGKPVFAYANVEDEAQADLLGRVRAWIGADEEAGGVWRDADGCEVEDLGFPESLMLWAEARRFYVIVTPDPFAETAGLELCLEALRLYAE
jgi:nucleoside 2-deoxyribosyltransferase